jgi:outer membrane protein
MKRILPTLATILVAATAAAWAQSPAALKIGVFDANRVSEETDEGKRIAAKLSAFGDKKKADLAAKEKEIGDLRAQLDSQNLSLSPEKMQQMQKDVQKKGLELQQAQEAARNEFQIEVSDAQNKFQEQLIRVINQFGREEGFTLVIERSTGGVAFASESIDVTTAIVDKFNELVKAPADGAAPAAAKPPAAIPPPPAKKP